MWVVSDGSRVLRTAALSVANLVPGRSGLADVLRIVLRDPPRKEATRSAGVSDNVDRLPATFGEGYVQILVEVITGIFSASGVTKIVEVVAIGAEISFYG